MIVEYNCTPNENNNFGIIRETDEKLVEIYDYLARLNGTAGLDHDTLMAVVYTFKRLSTARRRHTYKAQIERRKKNDNSNW